MTATGDRQRGDLLAATGENLMTVDSLPIILYSCQAKQG